MNAGHWTLPGGGLDFGEDPEVAVVREFMEETGLVVKVNKLVGIDSLCDSMPGWSPMHSIRIIYAVDYVSGELRYEHQGSTDLCAWHTHTATQELPVSQYGYAMHTDLYCPDAHSAIHRIRNPPHR